MKGTVKISVQAKRIRFDFTIRRNLTIVRGDSATGKTTLVDMISQYIDNPSGSPVTLSSDKPCAVLSGRLWKSTLTGIRDSVVFIDEGNEFVSSTEFADAISKTDNYYVIITRESLSALPYSVEEIYGIHYSGKYGSLKQVYNEFYRIYGSRSVFNDAASIENIITEDSNSGYEFFSATCGKEDIRCISAEGKSNIFKIASEKKENTLIIADGAAFGPEMNRIEELLRTNKKLSLYLPESFEWLILRASIFTGKELSDMLEKPSDFIESRMYFSWERYFTEYLISISKDGYLAYSKKKLNRNYLNDSVADKIIQTIPIKKL